MHVSLTPELEARVKAKVESGLYNNDLVREALRFMETHEEWIRHLKLAQLSEQLNLGAAQLDADEGIMVGSMTGLDTLFSDIKSSG